MAKVLRESVTLEECATLLELSIYRIRQLVSSGELTVIGKKDNKRLLIAKSEVAGIVAMRQLKESRARLAQEKRKESVRSKTLAASIRILEVEKPKDWIVAKKILDSLLGKGKSEKANAISEATSPQTADGARSVIS